MRLWLAVAIYLAVLVVTARVVFIWFTGQDFADDPDLADDPDDVLFAALFIGMFWPCALAVAAVVVPVAGVGWLISRPSARQRRSRARAKDEQEARRLRLLAAEYGLPHPAVDIDNPYPGDRT